jgi:hypothetical protein
MILQIQNKKKNNRNENKIENIILLAADGPFPGVLSSTFHKSRIFSEAIVVTVLTLFINGSKNID